MRLWTKMISLKSKVISTVAGLVILTGIATTSEAMMIIDQIPVGCTEHEVERGETLTSIARKYGVSIEHILKYNQDIKNPDLILARRPGTMWTGTMIYGLPNFVTITAQSDPEFILRAQRNYSPLCLD